MDIKKQPGILFENIILKELVFSRKEGFPGSMEFSIHLEEKPAFSNKNDKLIYELTCVIVEKSDFFNIKCAMVGIFSVIEGQENMDIREYSKLNAPANIMPYIRETIMSTTAKAGMSPVIIPPMNLDLLRQNANKEVTQ